MKKVTWYASEVVTPDAYEMYADLSPAKAWMALVRDLKDAKKESDVVRLTIGLVEAASLDEALDEIRAGHWVEKFSVTIDELDMERQPL